MCADCFMALVVRAGSFFLRLKLVGRVKYLLMQLGHSRIRLRRKASIGQRKMNRYKVNIVCCFRQAPKIHRNLCEKTF